MSVTGQASRAHTLFWRYAFLHHKWKERETDWRWVLA